MRRERRDTPDLVLSVGDKCGTWQGPTVIVSVRFHGPINKTKNHEEVTRSTLPLFSVWKVGDPDYLVELRTIDLTVTGQMCGC